MWYIVCFFTGMFATVVIAAAVLNKQSVNLRVFSVDLVTHRLRQPYFQAYMRGFFEGKLSPRDLDWRLAHQAAEECSKDELERRYKWFTWLRG